MKLLFTKSFDREYRQLVHKNRKYEPKVNKTLTLHKLSNLEVYSVSVDMKIRILFVVDDNKLHLLHIGNHGEVY